jgi:queuine tRNA-ribosyltransferase
MPIRFELIKTCKQSGARLGRLETPHGVFETPFFMPVGTQGTVKTLSAEEAKEVSEGLILANTYHLWLQPGMDVIKDHGSLREFMGWDGALLTDSGGFQVFSLTDMRKITEEGVHFRHHKNGSPLFLSPEKAIEIQETIGADIIMSFDECPPPYSDVTYMEESVMRTLRWAKRGKDALSTDQALFGIVQGGLNKDLRRKSAEGLMDIGFPGYSVGGLSVGEKKHEMYEVTSFIDTVLPKNKPRYLMGVGSPDDLVENVINGMDMFDCVLPTRIARHGTAWTTTGKIVIKNNTYANDTSMLDPGLDTWASRMSKAYVRHLLKADELLGKRIVTIQNLAYLKHLMAEIRQAIMEDRLLDFRDALKQKTNYFKT